MNKRYMHYILVGVPVVMTLLSAAMKLTQAPMAIEMFKQFNLSDHMVAIGLMEFAFPCLFLVPGTRHIGFFLLNAYFGGAIATDLASGASPVMSTVVLGLFWISMWMQEPRLFTPLESRHKK